MQLYVFLSRDYLWETTYLHQPWCVCVYMCVGEEASTDPGIIIMKYSTVQLALMHYDWQRVHIWV